VELAAELERVAEAAAGEATGGERLAGVIATEPTEGVRVYLCAFENGEAHTWLALDEDLTPVGSRSLVRDAASIAALCELAEEIAGGGDLDELRSQLVALRMTENPPGIEEAEEAALALQAAIGGTPRVATPAHLDAVGAATLRLEEVLSGSGSPFANALKQATATVQELLQDVEASYKRPLS
jgi:hypothetical protein